MKNIPQDVDVSKGYDADFLRKKNASVVAKFQKHTKERLEAIALEYGLDLSEKSNTALSLLITRYELSKTDRERSRIADVIKNIYNVKISKVRNKNKHKSLVGYKTMFDHLKSKGVDISLIKITGEEKKKQTIVKTRLRAISSSKICPEFPTKKTYASLKQAKRALKSIGKTYKRAMGHYLCPTCKMYHLTTNR